jgi:hypothetical protein
MILKSPGERLFARTAAAQAWSLRCGRQSFSMPLVSGPDISKRMADHLIF